jgi:uncharacterized heparinase superfamily protein
VSRYESITGGRPVVPVEEARVSLMARVARTLGLRRRSAVRLLAVPRDPVAGDKAVGAAMLEGWFDHGGQRRALPELDPADAALPVEIWERLQGFAWLRDLAAAANHERGRSIAEPLTRAWLERLPERPEGPMWRADLWGRRLLFWPAYAPYLLASRDEHYRRRMLLLLKQAAQHIERSGDKCRAGLPRIAAWSGAVAAALLVQGAEDRIARREGGLARALRGGLSEDGGLISRAPFEQLELVELLGLLRAAYATTTRGMPDWLEEAQQGALATLLCVRSADGGLSSWQGGNPGDPARLRAALESALVGEVPPAQARGWGYQRLQAKEAVLILDAAPPPPAAAHPGGCASTLAFEYCDGPQRLVVNCGGVGEQKSRLPGEWGNLLRSTAAHSALTLGEFNSTSILAGGGLGRGVTEVNLERGTRDGQLMVEGSHDGYVRRYGLVHQRRLLLAPDGKSLEGIDVLIPKGRTGKQPVPFVLRFHMAPGVEVTRTADGRGALLRVRGQKPWQFKCRGGMLEAEDSIWIDGTADPRPTLQLAMSGESPPDGMTISWELKRAG